MSVAVAWPTPVDYHAAVQNPAQAFADAELQAGRVVQTPLGLPRVASGNFASVYQLMDGSGVPRSWAVRCFLRQVTDTQRRYAAIDQYLRANRPGALVGFAYLAQGVRVRGAWYPVLKMDWVAGQPLNFWVESNLGQPDRLRGMADRWIDLMADLAGRGVAHGDLQHGNVLVHGDELRLVDYDGMYVPPLQGLPAAETGHPAYQHPARGARDFGPEIDRFSALVILVALRALTVEPGLWDRFNNGDNLLFRPADFRDPAGGVVWSALGALRDDTVARPLDALRAACRDPRGVPPVDDFRPRPPGRPTRQASAGPTQGWWRSYLPPEPAGPANGAENGGEGKGRPWWAAFSLNGRRGPGSSPTQRDPPPSFPKAPGPKRANGSGPGQPRSQGNGRGQAKGSRLPGWVRVLQQNASHFFEGSGLASSRAGKRQGRGQKQPPALPPAPTTGPVIVSRSGRRFHRPTCGLVARIGPDKVAGYPSRADALKTGFQPCRTCKP